jgi:hypothetical protein
MSGPKLTKTPSGGLKSSNNPPLSSPLALPRLSRGNGADAYAVSWSKLRTAYIDKTPASIKALDVYLLYCFATGMLQLAYCIVTRGKNYQSFLGGFLSCVGSFVLAGLHLIVHLIFHS